MQAILFGLRMQRYASSVLAALCASLTLASAADVQPGTGYTTSPTASRHYGCYVGVMAEAIVSHPEVTNIPVPGTYSEFFAKGGRGGGVAGCDVYFASHTFVGIDLTAMYGRLRGTHASGFTNDLPFESALRARLGYMLDPGVAVYVAGGPAVASMKFNDPGSNNDSPFIWGGQLAVGTEWYFTSAWRIRGEYAYTYYGSDRISPTGFPLARMNPTSHSARLGVLLGF